MSYTYANRSHGIECNQIRLPTMPLQAVQYADMRMVIDQLLRSAEDMGYSVLGEVLRSKGLSRID
jgi:hypothetical protein